MKGISMRLSTRARAGAACLSLGMLMVLVGTGTVQAEDSRTLASFLTSCNMHSKDCRYNLHDYTVAASTQGMICMPSDLSVNEAVDQELNWLRSVGAQKSELYNGNAEDAEWAAMSTLWPCQQNQTQTATR